MDTNVDICQECGAVIDQAVFSQPGPFGINLVCRQTLCVPCSFAAYLRRFRSLPCPYKTKLLRPTRHGGVPAEFTERWKREKQSVMGDN